MTHWKLWLRQAAAALACVAGTAGAMAQAPAATGQLPVELFFRRPDMAGLQLSPSGQQMAVLVRRNQRQALAVLDLEGKKPPVLVANYGDADVETFQWTSDARLVYSLGDHQRGGSVQRFNSGLFAVTADGVETRTLIRAQEGLIERRLKGRDPLGGNHQLLWVPRSWNDEVIVGEYQGETELRAVVPLRLNVVTQQVRSLGLGMPEGARRWLFDSQGEPRVAVAESKGRVLVHWRAPGAQDWKQLADMPALRPDWQPHSVDDKGGLYVLVQDGPEGIAVLKRFDFATARPAGEALVKAAGFDFNGQLIRDRDGQVLGVRTEADAEVTVWFHPKLKQWQDDADKQLPGRVNRLSCRRCNSDDPVVLVVSWSDRQPGEAWLYRPARQQALWSPIGALRKDVDERRMATLDFYRFKARDGLEIPVWLTLPLTDGKLTTDANKRPRPAVLLVHGGPWVRGGEWGWNGEAQFLASRGYVVIEPEARASLGYGFKHFAAGNKQWGQAMQNDLADAVLWAAKQGWVDPKRVCIAGGSYGGYAALMGPVRHPELFRCAASWMGVTDLRQMYEAAAQSDISDEARKFGLPVLMGDPKADAAMLAEQSPVVNAAHIKVPVLLVVGAQDMRVPLVHGELMRDALKKAGNPPQWEVYPDEGHGWYNAEARIDFFRKFEAFLAKNLN